MNYKPFHCQVRSICETAGWSVWDTYNDKRKNDRRLSYARNGKAIKKKMKKKILSRINVLIASENMNANVYWHKAKCFGHDDYDKLCIVVVE